MIAKLLLSVCVAAIISGCAKTPEQTTSVNSEFQVDRLFTHDGCTVYRFKDAGAPRYFSRCSNFESKTSWREGCGKSCTREVSIDTNREQQ